MFHPSVKRLIWKEFRTQWHIWLSLLVGTFLMQLLFLVRGSGFATIGAFPFYVATTLTFCFAATCGALLFAGEREESTFGLLRSLPNTTARLAIGKLLFAVVSVVSFGAAATSLGAVVWSFDPHPQAIRGFMTWEHLLQGYLPGILGCLLWSVFYSLLLSRVMVVIVCAVLTEFAVTGLITNPLSDYASTEVAVRSGFYTLLAVVDVWLMGRWWRNEALPLPWQGGARQKRPKTRRSIDVSLGAVRWASARRTLGMRTFAVLVWRELRAAVPFLLWWGLLGFMLVDIAMRFHILPGSIIWLIATPLVCGLMTCSGDQQRQTFRSLGERGLNKTAVWMSKHVVWLPLAASLILVFGFYDVALETLMPGHGRRLAVGSVAHAIEVGFRDAIRLRYPDDPSGWGLQVPFVIWTGLMLYSVGHVCALWLRRPVVAVAVAGVTGALVIPWVYAITYFDVPFMLGVAPLLLALIVGTWTTTSAWLIGDRSWRQLAQKAVWIVLPITACVLGGAVYRAVQIPDVGPGFNWQARQTSTALDSESKRILPIRIREMRQGLGTVLGMSASTDGDQAETESAFGLEALGGGRASGPPPDEAQRAAIIDEFASAANDIARIVGDTSGQMNVDLTGIDEATLRTGLVAGAKVARADGRLDESWQLLRDGLIIESAIARNATGDQKWWSAEVGFNYLLMEITRWTTADEQTSERLQTAIDWFHEHSDTAPQLVEMLKSHYIHQRQLIEGTHPRWEAEIQNQTLDPLFYSSPWGVGERQRTLRLLGITTHALLASLDEATPTSHVSHQNINRWMATTPSTLMGTFSQQIERTIRDYKSHQQWGDVIWNGAQLVLRLQLYHMENGQFPERLDQLPGELTPSLIHDPMGSGNFGYAPDGFPLQVVTSRDDLFPAGQPLLWSKGYQDGTLTKHGTSTYVASNINSIYLQHVVSDDNEVKPLQADKIRFVILGQSF